MAVRDIIDTMIRIHPLDRVPRAGYLLRGVTEPESVSAHSHSLALLTFLVCEEHPGLFDTAKAIQMALLHDLQEVVTMDIPLPTGGKAFRTAKEEAELEIFSKMFSKLSPRFEELHGEFSRSESAEARLVRGLDKAQMMIKIFCYEREGRGRLEDFWKNSVNLSDYDLPVLKELFEEIAAMAGKQLP